MQIENKYITFTIKFVAGISKGGYLILPLLTVAFGSNGFGIHLLGFYTGASFGKNRKETSAKNVHSNNVRKTYRDEIQ